MQAAAHEVDPQHRVPGVLAKGHLAEHGGIELAQDQVAIDPVVARQRRRVEVAERLAPAIREREPALPPGLAGVGPLVVVAMVADGGRDVGLEREQLVEEVRDEVGERGHGASCRVGGRAGDRWVLRV